MALAASAPTAGHRGQGGWRLCPAQLCSAILLLGCSTAWPSLCREHVNMAQRLPLPAPVCRHAQEGWPSSMYGMSKLAEAAYTRVLARELEPRHIMVNALCPGGC